MGRKRKHNKHLPKYVELHHGAYYYRRHGKREPLGKTLPEMYRRYADFVDVPRIRLMTDLITRYRLKVLPKKAKNTQVTQVKYLERIEAFFGRMRPIDVRPVHITSYRDRRNEKAGPVTANRELEVVKHMFRMACEWGAVDRHPGREVRKLPEPKRKRVVTDAEYVAAHALAPPMIQVAMDLAILTGLRRADLLALTRDNLTDDGILTDTEKTDKPLLIQWTPALVAVIKQAKSLPPQVRGPIIATRQGKAYTGRGFGSNWQRFMGKCVAHGVEHFQFKDLRSKSATDDIDGQAASERLGHTSRATTEKHYRRGPAKVRPLR